MTNKFESLQDKLMEFTAKVQTNSVVKAISSGLMGGMGILIAGTVINLIINLPIPAFIAFLQNIGIYDFLTQVVKIFNLTAPITAFLVGMSYAREKGINTIQVAVACLMAYFLVIPSTFDEAANGSFAFASLGAENMAAAIIVGLLASTLFVWSTKKNFVIRFPESVPAFVSESMSAIPAACITLLPFVVIKYVLSLTPFGNLGTLITTIISAPLASVGNTLGGHLLIIALSSICWWFGIHNSPVSTVAMVAMLPAYYENLTAVMSGQPAPYLLTFMSLMVANQLTGGPGCVIGLGIDTLLFAKSERYKAQGRIQFIPVLCNIIEPSVFGMPIVLNPIFFIPFLFVPIIIYVLYYICMTVGLCGTPIVLLSAFIPGFIQGFFMGGGIGLGIFMVFAAFLSCVLYLPFVLIADRQALKEEQAEEQCA